MTAYDHPTSGPTDGEHAVAGQPTPPAPHSDEIHTALAPVTVWWLGNRDHDRPATRPEPRFASRFIRRLVLTYTRRGDALVDFDGDADLRRAAKYSAREYLALTDPSKIADLDRLTEPATLVVVRWPRGHAGKPEGSVNDLFLAYRLIMTGDTSLIAITTPNRDADASTDHVKDLLPAAKAAGLTHKLGIIAVSRPGAGDRYLFYASRAEAAAAIEASRHDTSQPPIYVDLFDRREDRESR